MKTKTRSPMLYPHQQKFIDDDPDKAILAYETGTGKSHVAKIWLDKRAHLNPLVVCPKAIMADWEDDQMRWWTTTKENFKKIDLSVHGCIVVDEAQRGFLSGLFITGRSKMAETLYKFIKKNPDVHVLILTATPISSSPWNAHTILTYVGKYIDHRKFRATFFDMVKRPYSPYPIPEPAHGWRKMARNLIAPHVYYAALSDIITVPTQNHVTVPVKTDRTMQKYKICEEEEGTARFVCKHKTEGMDQSTLKKLLEIAESYRKVVVVCHYREQIEFYQKNLEKHRDTFSLHGGVKDQPEIIKKAQERDECFIIIQGDMGAGFDLDTFACMIFVSMSYSHASFVQMKGRILRIHNPHANDYHYLLPGPASRAVYNRLEKGKDFSLALHGQDIESDNDT